MTSQGLTEKIENVVKFPQTMVNVFDDVKPGTYPAFV